MTHIDHVDVGIIDAIGGASVPYPVNKQRKQQGKKYKAG